MKPKEKKSKLASQKLAATLAASAGSVPPPPATVPTNREGKPLERSRTFNPDSPEPSYVGAFVDKQRDSDLVQGAKFRFGEMVWCQIPQGRLSSSSIKEEEEEEEEEDEGFGITHWPAIVKHREERTESILDRPYISGSDAVPKFLNTKRWVYDVIYIGTMNEATGIEETDIKNWLSTGGPSATVWERDRLLNPETVNLVFQKGRTNKVDLGNLDSLELAVGPLAYAMQISAHIMSSFSLV
jgi:hypothetical protein